MTRRIFVPLSVFMLFIFPSCLYAMGTPPPHKHIPLRVLVKKNARNVILRIKGPYKIVDFGTGDLLKEGKKLRRYIISGKDIGTGGIGILSERKARIYIDGRRFRGNINVIKNNKGGLLVINRIDLEEYLYGVLYHEISHRWPMEVLKAQAIAARTYALYQKLINKDKYFDLSSDIYSQVYGGVASETWRTRRAVNLTCGLVLTYDGKIFPSYYHATCGGRTSDASSIWGIDVPPLRGRICDFCSISPYYRWKKELTMEYIQDKCIEAGYNIKLNSIEILRRDNAGRILDMVLKGTGSNLKLSGNKFRLIIGPNIIRSTNFEIHTKGKYLTFYGKGWGHGVGMCQWGAYGMARKGYTAEEILEYYYPGAEIVRLE